MRVPLLATLLSTLCTLLFTSTSIAARVAAAPGITRAEVLEIARAYAEFRWIPSTRNARHGLDTAKIEVHTPDRGHANEPNRWILDQENEGVPYKWGGFDTLQSFATGVRTGKAAGDLYSAEKRKKGGQAVSAEAVGVDCSGFISRCWKLPGKRGTATLPALCDPLSNAGGLKPGDVMNVPGGHVMLFVRWLDDGKTRALFFEAEPFSKVLASEHEIAGLLAAGFKPLRYRKIRE